MALQGRGKEFHELLRKIGELTEGQARVAQWDPDNMTSFTVEVIPNGGHYKGETHTFKIILEDNYPDMPPTVICTSLIFHPNIDPRKPPEQTYSNVCLNILELGEWCPGIGLVGCVVGLVYLLHNPNILDPISPHFFGLSSEKDYAKHLKELKKGNFSYGVNGRRSCCCRLLRRIFCCFCCCSCCCRRYDSENNVGYDY